MLAGLADEKEKPGSCRTVQPRNQISFFDLPEEIDYAFCDIKGTNTA